MTTKNYAAAFNGILGGIGGSSTNFVRDEIAKALPADRRLDDLEQQVRDLDAEWRAAKADFLKRAAALKGEIERVAKDLGTGAKG